MTKAKAYTLHPEGVNFVNSRKANKISNEVRWDTASIVDTRHVSVDGDIHDHWIKHFYLLPLPQRLYRETYHKQKDKIHTTYDTPDIRQVKMNQEHLSDVWTYFHKVYVNHVPIFIHNAVFFTHAIFVFPSHSSCGTERNTTAPKASWFLCPSRPSWCTATMSMRSPATYVKKEEYIWCTLSHCQKIHFKTFVENIVIISF